MCYEECEIVVKLIYIVIMVALSGCAADVHKDNSADLQNENTNLKLQIQQTKLDLKQASENVTSQQRALEQCYKTK